MSNVGINQGTQTFIATDTVGTEVYQKMKLDMGAAGATNPFTGTLSIDQTGIPASYWGTTVSTGTTTLGTIKPTLGAGTRIYITDITISAGSTTVVVVGDGGTATPVIGSLSFLAQGGMVANYKLPVRTSQGGTLVYQQSVGGPLTITAQGYFGP